MTANTRIFTADKKNSLVLTKEVAASTQHIQGVQHNALQKNHHTQSCLKTLMFSQSSLIHCLNDIVEAAENIHLQDVCIHRY